MPCTLRPWKVEFEEKQANKRRFKVEDTDKVDGALDPMTAAFVAAMRGPAQAYDTAVIAALFPRAKRKYGVEFTDTCFTEAVACVAMKALEGVEADGDVPQWARDWWEDHQERDLQREPTT